MSTGRVYKLIRAGAIGNEGEGLLRAYHACQITFPNARNELAVNYNKSFSNNAFDVAPSIKCQMPRRFTTLVPRPFEWDGPWSVSGQMCLPLGELWEPIYQTDFADSDLPELNVSHAYVCEIKTAFLASAYRFGLLTNTDVAPASYGRDFVLAGQVPDIRVTARGKNYTSIPTVTITGDGTGATATAALSTDRKQVAAITITNRGHGYNPETTQVIISGGGGEGAEARATVNPLGGIDYFNDGSLFFKQPLGSWTATSLSVSFRSNPPETRLYLARPGANEEQTNGLSDATICEVREDYNTGVGVNQSTAVVSGYTPGVGWFYDLDYWPAPIETCRGVNFDSSVNVRHLFKQAVRLDPITRQPTQRWWLPEPGQGSIMRFRLVKTGTRWYPFGGIAYPAKNEFTGELETNPARGLSCVSLVWPECRGNSVYITGTATMNRKLLWRVMDPPKCVGTYDASDPTYGSPGFRLVAPMKSLLEADIGATPPGWNLLCNIPSGTEGFMPFVTQPAVGQLVVISRDLEAIQRPDFGGQVADAYLFPIGTRLPYMLRGKNGMVGGWDGLTAV